MSNYTSGDVPEADIDNKVSSLMEAQSSDSTQASMMVETSYLVLAVRNLYNQTKDFEKISKFI